MHTLCLHTDTFRYSIWGGGNWFANLLVFSKENWNTESSSAFFFYKEDPVFWSQVLKLSGQVGKIVGCPNLWGVYIVFQLVTGLTPSMHMVLDTEWKGKVPALRILSSYWYKRSKWIGMGEKCPAPAAHRSLLNHTKHIYPIKHIRCPDVKQTSN